MEFLKNIVYGNHDFENGQKNGMHFLALSAYQVSDA